MNKRILSSMTLFLLGVAVISLAGKAGAFPFNQYENRMGFSPPFGIYKGMPPGGPLGNQLRMIQSLGLSLEQQLKVQAIIAEFRPQVQANIISLHKGRRQMKNMAIDEINEVIINQLADLQGEAIVNLIKLRGKIGKNIRAVLTNEQKEQLSIMISSRSKPLDNPFPFN